MADRAVDKPSTSISEHVVTTETMEGNRGRIQMRAHDPQSPSEHLVHVDILVEPIGGDPVWLDRVDADKLLYVLREIAAAVGRPGAIP